MLPSGFDIMESGGARLLGTDSHDNFFSGQNAGNTGMQGYNNTAIGSGALADCQTGNGNTAIGTSALNANTSGYNTAVGLQALRVNNGLFNTAVGAGALVNGTSGDANTAVGDQALFQASGTQNIGLGYWGGVQVTTGNNNIEIYDEGRGDDNGVIRIGTPGTQTSTYIAGIHGATVTSEAVYVDSSGHLGTLTSSVKYKNDIQAMDASSDVLFALKPVTFKYKPELDPQGTPQFGLVAEEVEKVDPALVAHDEQGKPYTVRYQAVDAMLLNEFLKQHKKVEAQGAEIQALRQEIEKLRLVERPAAKTSEAPY
jgi:hypothetical protein